MAIIPRLERGGQEHDIFRQDERVFKVTRNGGFLQFIKEALASGHTLQTVRKVTTTPR